MQHRWQSDASADLAWRHWDDEYVVHHALSNDTHRLAELPGLVLTLLHGQAEGMTREALAEACDAEPEAIDDALTELGRIGLVRAC